MDFEDRENLHRLKFRDTESAQNYSFIPVFLQDATGGPSSGSLLPVRRGNGQSRRVGNQIRVRWVHVRAEIRIPAWNPTLPAQNARNTPSVRLALVLDKMNGDQNGNWEPSRVWSPGDFAESVLQFRNMDWVSQFEVLRDEVIDLKMYNQSITAEADTSHSNGRSWHVQWDVPVDFITEYELNTSGPFFNTQIKTNNLRFGAWCNNNEMEPQIRCYFRVRFSDYSTNFE